MVGLCEVVVGLVESGGPSEAVVGLGEAVGA